MEVGRAIRNCPFVPFVLGHPESADYSEIKTALSVNGSKPHLFLLCQNTCEFPSNNAKQYVVCHVKHIRDVCRSDYSSFVDIMLDIMTIFSENDGMADRIGIASRSSPDLAGFFIVRWLIEELEMAQNEALKVFSASCPPGITKVKYLNAINRICNGSTTLIEDGPPKIETPCPPVPRPVNGEYMTALENPRILQGVRGFGMMSLNPLPLTKYDPLTGEALKMMRKKPNDDYVIILEPDGRRALIHWSKDRCDLYVDDDGPEEIVIGSDFTGSAILEGVIVSDDVERRRMFVISDILMLNDVSLRNDPFDVRMAKIEDEVFGKWAPQDNDTFVLAIRPFYKLQDYAKIMRLFTGGAQFKRFPVSGILFIPLDRGARRPFLWEPSPKDKPRVVVHVSYSDLKMYGHATTKSTDAVVVYLGIAEPGNIHLHGKVVEIEIAGKDSVRPDLLRGTVIREVADGFPWSVTDFLGMYRFPLPSASQLEHILSKLCAKRTKRPFI